MARPARGAGAAAGGHGWLGVCTGTLQPHQAPHQRHGRRRSWHSYGKEAGAGSWQCVCFQASDKAGFSCFSARPGSGTAAGSSSCPHCTSASPVPQRALLSHSQTPLPIFHRPWQRHPAHCHPVKDTLPFSLDKVPASVFSLVPTARVVAPAVPHSSGLPAQLSQGLKSQAGLLLEISGVGGGSTNPAMPLALLAAAR